MPGSINQNTHAKALPNFRNLGVLLRILVMVSVMMAGAAIVKGSSLADIWRQLLAISSIVQPALMLSLVLLVLLSDLLKRMPYTLGFALVMALALVVGIVAARFLQGIPKAKRRAFFVRVNQITKYPRSSLWACGLTIFLALWPTLLRGHFPYPSNHDELCYHVAADTFARGRLSNPSPAAWEHFETFHVSVVPTYYAKYQPGMGLILAVGQVLGGPLGLVSAGRPAPDLRRGSRHGPALQPGVQVAP